MSSDSAQGAPTSHNTADTVSLAMSLFSAQHYTEALPLLEQLVDAGNTPIACILALADAREGTGDAAGAIRLLENLYRALPQDDFAVALVAALQRAGIRAPLDEWLPRLRAAHPSSSRLAAMQAEHALKSSDFAIGFDLMPHRWSISIEQQATASLPCPAWDGKTFPGTLLIGTEQGLGDVVLWSSTFSDLAQRNQHALVACDARLVPLFRRSFPTLEFADRNTSPLAAPGSDLANRKVEAADLARFFRRSVADFPPHRAWLAPDPARRDALRRALHARFPGKRLIGLSWRSLRNLRTDSKNVPIEELAPLFARPDTIFVNLQYGDITADLATLHARDLHLHLVPDIDTTHDIDGVSALAAALDGVVSSSNTMAHIAGALGLRTWIMVPGGRYVLWYWGYTGNTVPWYPSARILRGPPQRSWRELAVDIAADY